MYIFTFPRHYRQNEVTVSKVALSLNHEEIKRKISIFQKKIIFKNFQDIFGKRGILAFSCALLTIPVFGLLAFSTVFPLVSTLWLGFTYSVAAVSLILKLKLNLINQITDNLREL